LVEAGYAHASTNAIAERAGVSVGSLYQYFAGKEQVYRAVLRRHRDEVLPNVLALLTSLSDPREDIADASVRLMQTMAEVHGRNPGLMRAIEGELGWLEHEDDEALDILPVVTGVLRARLTLPAGEVEAIAALLVEVVSHLSRWLVHAQPAGMALGHWLAAAHRMLRGLLAVAPSEAKS
jgi:AcrR family transcriptional regulator